MKKMPTTDTGIAKLPPPSSQCRLRHPDRSYPLYLLHSPGGTKTFQFIKTIQGRSVQKKIGTWPVVNVEQAEGESLDILRSIKKGEEQRTSELQEWTVEQSLADYLNVTSLKDSTARAYESYLDRLGWNDRLMVSFSNPREFETKAIKMRKSGESEHNVKKAFSRLAMVAKHWNERLPRGVFPFPIAGINLAYRQAKHRTTHHPAFARDGDWATAVALAESSYSRNPVAATHWLVCAFTGLRTWEEAARVKWSMLQDLFDDAPYIDFDATEQKINGAKRHDAEMRPDVFRKYLNPLAVAALRRWHNDMRRERYMFDQRRDFVFPSRNSTRFQMTSPGELLETVKDELEYRVVYYSMRRFYINQRDRCDIEAKYRYALTDHSIKELGIAESEYGDIYDEHLYSAEIVVGDRLKALLDKHGVAVSV